MKVELYRQSKSIIFIFSPMVRLSFALGKYSEKFITYSEVKRLFFNKKTIYSKFFWACLIVEK